MKNKKIWKKKKNLKIILIFKFYILKKKKLKNIEIIKLDMDPPFQIQFR